MSTKAIITVGSAVNWQVRKAILTFTKEVEMFILLE